mgnify:CR=1 FL=1
MTTFTSSLERLSAAQALFYSGTGLDDGALLKVLGRMTPAGADWADIYLQQTVSRSWILDEGAVKTGGFSIDRGAGLRTVCGETSTLAYTDVLTPVSLLDAAGTAVASAAYSPEGAPGVVIPACLTPGSYRPCCGTEDASSNMHTPQALELIREADALAREADPRVTDVVVTLQCETDATLLCRLDGLLSGDIRPMVYLSISVIASENGTSEPRPEAAHARGLSSSRGSASVSGLATPSRRQSTISAPHPHLQASCPSCSVRAGPAFCSTRPWATDLKATSSERAPPPSRAGSACASHPPASRSSTTARSD